MHVHACVNVASLIVIKQGYFSQPLISLTQYSIVTLFNAFEISYNMIIYHENIMENGAFAPKEQMLLFHNIFKSIQNLIFFSLIFQCCLKLENDVII